MIFIENYDKIMAVDSVSLPLKIKIFEAGGVLDAWYTDHYACRYCCAAHLHDVSCPFFRKMFFSHKPKLGEVHNRDREHACDCYWDYPCNV